MRRAAYLVFILLFPAVVLVAYALHLAFPAVPDALFFGGAFLVLVVVWSAVAVADRNRRRREAHIMPRGKGFAAELESVATRLREHAKEIERDRRVAVSGALREFLGELRIKASTFDHHEIVVGFDLDVPDPSEFREAAAELEEYAADVRSRGGIRYR
jgi:type II secretory pathway component PulM